MRFQTCHISILCSICLVAQWCPALCEPMDCSPAGSSGQGILRTRILEWVAISFSRGSSQPRIKLRSPTLQANSLPPEPPGVFAYFDYFSLFLFLDLHCSSSLLLAFFFSYSLACVKFPNQNLPVVSIILT